MKRITFLKHASAVVMVSALTVGNVNAQDSDLASNILQGWSGTASLGASSASGNSEASNINASIRLGKTSGLWEHLVFGAMFKGTSALLVQQRDEVTGELVFDDSGFPVREVIKGDNSDRIAIGYQPRYYWRPKTYFFGILDYEKDKPANIKLGSRQIIGIGHKFFSNEFGFLSGEAGVGNKNTKVVYGDNVDGGIGYLGLNYLNRINENVTFNADLRSDFGSDNTFTEIGLGVAFKLSQKMASSNDSVTNINLVIDI